MKLIVDEQTNRSELWDVAIEMHIYLKTNSTEWRAKYRKCKMQNAPNKIVWIILIAVHYKYHNTQQMAEVKECENELGDHKKRVCMITYTL